LQNLNFYFKKLKSIIHKKIWISRIGSTIFINEFKNIVDYLYLATFYSEILLFWLISEEMITSQSILCFVKIIICTHFYTSVPVISTIPDDNRGITKALLGYLSQGVDNTDNECSSYTCVVQTHLRQSQEMLL
jgi:hypothetical protein